MVQHLVVPIMLEAGVRKKKNFFLNLNQYNKWHFQDKNQLKKLFKIHILREVRELQPVSSCKITYTIFYPTNRKFDLDNVGSVVSKFTHDVLTEAGILVDDNYSILKELSYKFGGIDKNNPRCEVTIEELK